MIPVVQMRFKKAAAFQAVIFVMAAAIALPQVCNSRLCVLGGSKSCLTLGLSLQAFASLGLLPVVHVIESRLRASFASSHGFTILS